MSSTQHRIPLLKTAPLTLVIPELGGIREEDPHEFEVTEWDMGQPRLQSGTLSQKQNMSEWLHKPL